MTALMIYLVFTASHTWEFMAIEHAGNRAYCEMLSFQVQRAFRDKPGNIRILCMDDEGVEA